MTRDARADRFYTRWALVYDHVARRTPGIDRLRSRTVERMQLDRGMTVLDMGCGPGPNFRHLRQAVGRDGRVIGVDLASGALERARGHIAGVGWPNVHVLRANATDPPVSNVDAIVGAFVIGMFDDPATVVDRWCSLVGSGGKVGLLHFARSDRLYGPMPNALLRALVVVSTPGERRLGGNATAALDRRVREGHDVLLDRCTDIKRTTHWGGVVHVATGTVD